MIAIGVALLFALASMAAWLLLFPAARDAATARLDRLASRLGALTARWQTRASHHANDSSQAMRQAGSRTFGSLSRHRWLLIGSLTLLCLPPLLILQTHQQVSLDGFDAVPVAATDSQILDLLRGERLALPPELPPQVFVDAEAHLLELGPAVIAPERIGSADRKWQRIHPDFQQRVLAIYRVMREQYGVEMVLVEGYRSPERQAELARKGGHVTRAGAGRSCHQHGLALDSAPLRDGKLQWDMTDPWTKRAYFLYGELAVEAGLEWGGNWRSLRDYVHVEMKSDCRQARRAG